MKIGDAIGRTREYLLNPKVIVPLGFPTIDTLIRGGVRAGQVCQLIGRTETGKSTLALNIALNAMSAGHSVAFLSAEMTVEECTIRLLSIELGEGIDDTEKLLMGDDLLGATAPLLQKLSVFNIEDWNRPTWDQLGEWVRSIGAVDLVVVDHLKLMARYGYPKGEAERIAQLAEDAKAFAKEVNAALFVVHQVGRSTGVKTEEGHEKNHGHLPLTQEDGMYGGEQDADYILGVYRECLNPNLSANAAKVLEDKIVIQLVKNRHGKRLQEGVVSRWHLPSLRIKEV
jgi:replicative DNA helicase